MRVICENRAIAIKQAECEGKQLFFKDFDGRWYCTDDYFAENIAMCKLSDLVADGYIRVRVLRLIERS